MSTFVLVHGAWQGGWCWQRTAPLLERAGHEVHTPTLTGLSNTAHLLSPAVGLDTHIEDIVSYIEAYDLSEVTLVGHSYGGQVITGVADRIPDRLARRVHQTVLSVTAAQLLSCCLRVLPGTTDIR